MLYEVITELSTRAQFVDLFVAEAKTLVSLTHGNIVPIHIHKTVAFLIAIEPAQPVDERQAQ